MRIPNIPENVAESTVLDYYEQVKSANGNVGSVLARASVAHRVTVIPRWAGAVALYALTDGKHGLHPLHLMPHVAMAALFDAKRKADHEDIARVMLAHPDKNARQIAIPAIDGTLGKAKRVELQKSLA